MATQKWAELSPRARTVPADRRRRDRADALSGFLLINMTTLGDPPRPPSGLYNGMIAPLQPFRIRGVIWYQGEGNTWRAYQYRRLLPALIRGS